MPSMIMGEKLEVSKDMDTETRRVPLGVGAAICPYVAPEFFDSSCDIVLTCYHRGSFNFPAMIPLWSIPMAIATGNSLILKPSERDPGAAMIIAELAEKAGMFAPHCSPWLPSRTKVFSINYRSAQRSSINPTWNSTRC